MSFFFTASVAGFSINTKRIWSRCLAMGSTNSAVTPNAAVNHTELAQSSIRRPYQPSNSALLRGENSRTTDRSAIASAGLGVSPIAPDLAAASSGSVFTSFQYSKYCFAVAGSATRCPTFVWPRKPEAVKLVEPVHTSAGSVPPPEADDELVVRDLGPGSAKGGLLVVDGNARRLHGSFVGLSWCVARIVIGDLNVDATVDRALELVEDRRICEFVSRDAKAVAGRSPPDVSQACFEQAAREPNNLGVRRIVDVLGRSISKLLSELLARDRTAIEPNAVACAFFPLFLRLDLEPQLVLRVAGECAGLSVHRQDAKLMGRVRCRSVVAPQETLDRKVLGVEAL